MTGAASHTVSSLLVHWKLTKFARAGALRIKTVVHKASLKSRPPQLKTSRLHLLTQNCPAFQMGCKQLSLNKRLVKFKNAWAHGRRTQQLSYNCNAWLLHSILEPDTGSENPELLLCAPKRPSLLELVQLCFTASNWNFLTPSIQFCNLRKTPHNDQDSQNPIYSKYSLTAMDPYNFIPVLVVTVQAYWNLMQFKKQVCGHSKLRNCCTMCMRCTIC